MLVKFNNSVTSLGYLDCIHQVNEDDVKQIPQCYRYDAIEAQKLNNVILNDFIRKCFYDIQFNPLYTSGYFKYTSLDSRVHLLKPSMLPCIGGWHCDDFYRGEEGQPLLENIDTIQPQVHYICVIGSNSLPEFIVEDMTLDIDPKFVYKSLGERLDTIKKHLDIFKLTSGKVVKIGPSCIHRGVPATENGWRLFMRLTFSNHRFPKNEIRTQTQVYITNTDGW